MPHLKRSEAGKKMAGQRLDVFEQPGVERVEEHERRAAREEISAVGRPVIAWRDRLRHLLVAHRRADWNAGAKRLAERHQVRREAARAAAREFAGPAAAA